MNNSPRNAGLRGARRRELGACKDVAILIVGYSTRRRCVANSCGGRCRGVLGRSSSGPVPGRDVRGPVRLQARVVPRCRPTRSRRSWCSRPWRDCRIATRRGRCRTGSLEGRGGTRARRGGHQLLGADLLAFEVAPLRPPGAHLRRGALGDRRHRGVDRASVGGRWTRRCSTTPSRPKTPSRN